MTSDPQYRLRDPINGTVKGMTPKEYEDRKATVLREERQANEKARDAAELKRLEARLVDKMTRRDGR